MRNIAIFGGTFNPVHSGHVRLLETVCKAVKLDEIFVIPTKQPPHKEAHELASENDRLEMCRLAFGDFPCVKVSDYEFTREGKSYSYYTVSHFRSLYPDSRIYFIMGSDMLLSLDSWYRAEDLLEMCTPLCISRCESDSAAAREYAEKLKSGCGAIFVEAEPFEVSSTQIRKMIHHKKFTNLYCYLPKNVVKYIMEKNLYGQG
jgi:nicotinate-nucleotide adenylyltransferase